MQKIRRVITQRVRDLPTGPPHGIRKDIELLFVKPDVAAYYGIKRPSPDAKQVLDAVEKNTMHYIDAEAHGKVDGFQFMHYTLAGNALTEISNQ
jgi:hypothetical protein